MAVVRRSNCVQVIDPAPSPFFVLIVVSQALHLSFTCVSHMKENISKEMPVPDLGSPLVKDFKRLLKLIGWCVLLILFQL